MEKQKRYEIVGRVANGARIVEGCTRYSERTALIQLKYTCGQFVADKMAEMRKVIVTPSYDCEVPTKDCQLASYYEVECECVTYYFYLVEKSVD